MPATSPFAEILRPLVESGIPYGITGSIAAVVYGEPRLTNDIDFVVILRRADIKRLEATFPITEFYCPPTEVLLSEVDRGTRGMFNIIHHATGFKADFFVASRDPLHHWAMTHRREVEVDGQPLWLCPPEYVVIRKLEAFREGHQPKHRRDVLFILKCTELKRDFIESQVERLGLHEQWKLFQTAEE